MDQTQRLLAQLSRSAEFGIDNIKAEFNFADIMDRVQRIVNTVAPHDSIERYNQLGVDVIEGKARIISPWAVEVTNTTETRTITTLAIIIAAGARPFVPPIPGLENIDCLTSDNVWNLREQPKRMVVLGGGPIGCELAQCFARLGVQVIQVEMAARLLIREDSDVSDRVTDRFRQEGIDVRLEHTAKKFVIENGEKFLVAEHLGEEVRIAFDQVLVAIGRVANTQGYGLEEIGVVVSPRKTVQVDAFQTTNYPNIFACGDVAGPYQFTHTAAHQAWYARLTRCLVALKEFASIIQ